jgi:hypothetical protein
MAKVFATVLVMVCAGLGWAPAATAQLSTSGKQWALQLTGISHHFGKPRQTGMRFNETHDGLGMQQTQSRQGWITTVSFGVMKDSYDNQSAYAGGAVARRLRGHDLSVDVCLAPMLLYRTTRFDDWRGDAPLRLIPALLPTVTLNHRDGLGANLVALPRGNYGQNFKLPGVVFLQVTQRLQ